MGMIGKIMNIGRRGIRALRVNGIKGTAEKLTDKIMRKLGWKIGAYTKKELEKQKSVQFPREVKFSILVPLYNTPEQFLREMIESVQAQTYTNWQLCMADGSDDAHDAVGEICRAYAAEDSRITYRKLEKNMGIAGNTNACIELAIGDFIALFDHDDLLHPAALYEMMCAICDKGADFVYTDEDSFFMTPADAYSPHYKPDFAPDTFRSYNYICHFTAFSTELLQKTGGFRGDFDGSQDYDIFLRLTEQAECIVHIPKILYYWRNHAASTASNVSAKPYTMVSGKKALQEHLQRIGLRGTVMDSSVPTTYRISYELDEKPLVSVVIRGDKKEQTEASVRKVSTYDRFEIASMEDAQGEYIVCLEGGTEIITPDWIEQLLMFGQRSDVGAVGGLMYDENDLVYHAGQVIGSDTSVYAAHRGVQRGSEGYKFRLTLAQNYTAVSDACMMVRKCVWDELGGIDEKLAVYAGADLCLRMREQGYLVVWTPYAEFRCCRQQDDHVARKSFGDKWCGKVDSDPNYNAELDRSGHGFAVKI